MSFNSRIQENNWQLEVDNDYQKYFQQLKISPEWCRAKNPTYLNIIEKIHQNMLDLSRLPIKTMYYSSTKADSTIDIRSFKKPDKIKIMFEGE